MLGPAFPASRVQHISDLRSSMFAKNSPSGHHRTTFSGYIFTIKARIDNWKKKLVKQQFLPHMSLQYGELQPISG